MTDHLLTLSTQVFPARKFLVDGEEYQLLGLDHLSKEDEALAMALFSKYQQMANALTLEPDVQKGTQLALGLRKQRTRILCQLTDLPREVADRLPTAPAVRLLEALQAELEGAENDEPGERDTEEADQ